MALVVSATLTAEVATLAASLAFLAISLMLAPISSAPVATVCDVAADLLGRRGHDVGLGRGLLGVGAHLLADGGQLFRALEDKLTALSPIMLMLLRRSLKNFSSPSPILPDGIAAAHLDLLGEVTFGGGRYHRQNAVHLLLQLLGRLFHALPPELLRSWSLPVV